MGELLGKTISHYKVLHQIGKGGMGVLYLAEDLELNRKAVLKFLPADMMNDPETNLRFKREAQAAGSLTHPNIVTIYDVGVHENKTFIAMEYVDGQTLRDLIKSDELTIERITDISLQICEGLNEAHSKGITHRDIKPENILIDAKGKVKIVDFGLAKVTKVSKELTKEASTLGTIKYMSPEQIMNKKVDHRSDIWSFGVILYEMITGRYPFQGEYDASIFYSIINQSPEPLARYKSDIGEGFQRIIDKALDKETDTRYQHIDDLLSDLRREKKESGEFRIGKRRIKRLTPKILIIISALAFVVLCTALIIYLLNNPTKKVDPPKHTQLTFDGNIYIFEMVWLWDRSQISPDGQFTAYIIGKGNEKSIYIKDNSGEQAIEIFKGLRGVASLRWSPSSKEIFFCAILNDSSETSYIIPKLGGKFQELQFDGFGCWSPDEKLIAGYSYTKHILLIERETGEVVKTLELSGAFTWVLDIDWSPDGDKIVFLTSDDNAGKFAIWTIKTDGTLQQKILEETKIIYSPRWSSDGNQIYYLQSKGMTQDLMKIEISSNTSDRESKVIQTGLLAYGFSITRDNKKLCYTKYNVSSNLWSFIYNKNKNDFQSKKLTEGTSLFRQPVISPDDEEIAFVYNSNIFKMSINGASMRQLTFLNSLCRAPSWNPNGEEIAFLSGSNLAKVSSKGGTPTIFKNTTVGDDAFWVSDLEIFFHKTGNQNYYVFNPVTEENKLLVSNDSVGWIFNPHLSPDNLNIAIHWNRSPWGLWIISRKDSSQKIVLQGYINPLGWSKDSKWIYAVDAAKTPADIIKVSANIELTKLIYTLSSGKIDLHSDIDISSDGKIIICAIEETNSDVWMIENFDPDVE